MFTWSIEALAYKAGRAAAALAQSQVASAQQIAQIQVAGLRQVLGFTLAPLLDFTFPPQEYGGRLIAGRCEGCGETQCTCGAQQLAEREAEEEVAEPRLNDGYTPYDPQWKMSVADPEPRCTCPCINCSNQAHWMCHGEGVEIDTVQPNEYEPALTDDELVAVRQLIEERFPLQVVPESSPVVTDDPQAMSGETECGVTPPAPSSVSPHSQTRCDCCEQPTHFAAMMTGDGGESWVCKSCADALQACHPSPLSFADWATPAMRTVLYSHTPKHCDCGALHCGDDDNTHGVFEDIDAWHEHVAPILAERLERALESSEHFQLSRKRITGL